MKQAIHAALRPVRARQQLLFALRCGTVGLAAGAATGLALGLGRLLGLTVSPTAGVAALAAGPVLGLLAGLVLRRSWHTAASAVDGHYGLKDRAVTALAFADQSTPTEWHTLQIDDAMTHLGSVEPKAVVPMAAPKGWTAAVGGAVAAGVLLVWPLSQPEADAAPAPAPEHIAAIGIDQKGKLADLEKKLTETTQDLDDEKADDEKKGLKELIQKLAQKAEELGQDGTDEREALAKLSEMQADMQAMADQLNVAAMDGQMSSLGAALAAATAFEGAGKALQEGKLEKAAKELEKLDEVKLTPKEAKALEEKLKELSKKMGDAGQGSMSEAVGDLADSLKGGGGRVGKATKGLAKKVNNAVKRRKVNDLLLSELEELKAAKGDLAMNGGPRGLLKQKSDSPSNSWGRTTSGNIDGEKTNLGGKRNEVQLTGTPGTEGDSDVERTATPEARQRASREYQEKFQKFKKESETVVDGEAIPLGHRQTVKKYFELIRPSNGDAFDKKDAPADGKK